MEELTDAQLGALYAWIDAIPLSRPKRNMARDFSDGVLFAEVVAAYFPQLIELHNYSPANSVKQKLYNFETLNQRVLKKFGYTITRSLIEDIVNCKPGAVEFVLHTLQYKMAKFREKKSTERATTPRGGVSRVEGDISSNNSVSSFGRKGGGGGGSEGERSRTPTNSRSIQIQPSPTKPSSSVQEEILMEKERQIRELTETVEVLQLKIAKLEQLVRLKDNKIQKLMSKNS